MLAWCCVIPVLSCASLLNLLAIPSLTPITLSNKFGSAAFLKYTFCLSIVASVAEYPLVPPPPPNPLS